MKTHCSLLLVISTILLSAFPNIVNAQSNWALDIGAERSRVSINDSDVIWQSQHLEASWVREQVEGFYVGVENQERFGMKDVVFHANGYRRIGDWTIGGGMGFTVDADFWFRRNFQGELSRRIAGTVVASGAYRYLEFSNTVVHQPQMAIAWYHPRGEVQGRIFLTHNSIRDGFTATELIQTSYRIIPHLKASGAIAYGDRIFDIESLSGGAARAWVANAAFQVDISRHYAIVFGGGFAREKPRFKQQTTALSLRRSF